MERIKRIVNKRQRIVAVETVEDALKKHHSGVEHVVLKDVTPPQQVDLPHPKSSETDITSGMEYYSDEKIQTIPDPSHPIAEKMVEWLINGGPPPVDHSTIPDHLRGSEVTDDGLTIFPGVIANLDENEADETPEESDSSIPYSSFLKRVDEKTYLAVSRLVRRRIDHQFYSGD